MLLTLHGAQALSIEDLARQVDSDAAEWQNRIDSGRMTSGDWAQHEVFVACRQLLAGLGDPFPITDQLVGSLGAVAP
ncbi:hypothetical protein [Lentzea sp. NPDC092896]|uniref:hypothetical protein n=1 Tax=Lentzea sp. NPDC092896 TaxID=3364127 RepID=UPI00380373B9